MEEKKFWAKKLQKNGFFGVFTHYCTESLRNFTVVIRSSSNLQDGRLFVCARCASYKKGNFIRKKIKFWAKKLQKNGFFGDFTHYCTESLRNFTVVLRWCSNSQDSRLLIGQGAPVVKWRTLLEEKKFWARKLKKKGFFGGFTHYCTESLRNFTVVLRWCSNLQDGRLFDWARCDSNKMDNFLEEKKFWAKKLQKNGFLDFSNITARNRFAILL